MFEYLRRGSTPPDSLLGIIAEVRQRWRMKLALRGAVAVAGIAVALILVAALGLEWAIYSPLAVVASRLLLLAALGAAVYWFLVKPLRRKVTDEQVALYLEEHDPSLQATLISAVESTRANQTPASEALVRRLVEQAIAACAASGAPRNLERTPVRTYAITLAVVGAVSLASLLVGPAFIRHAMSALLLVSQDLEAAAPYRITVTPGNAEVPKGSAQKVTARLVGFDSEDVVLLVRRAPEAELEEIPLVVNDAGEHEGMVFDVLAPLEYYVAADRVESPRYVFSVVDLPYVQRIDFEYHFPAYTGLEPQIVENGGDIAVLRGTEVRMRIVPTMATPGGRVALNEDESIALVPEEDGSMLASFRADSEGFYRIELDTDRGERIIASQQYLIDVIADRPPTVSFQRPGRDTTASPIEEVFLEARAQDDYGVRDLELVYSVNGGPEKVVPLFEGRTRLDDVSAGHTIYFEELDVEAGDSVSYYARAADNDAVSGSKTAASDIYFVRVRPFRRDFRQAQSGAGGGGGGGGGGGQQDPNNVSGLSEQQRQIISATHNVQRDRAGMNAGALRESANVISLNQSRIREQVEGLIVRMNSQLVERDPAFEKIAELLPQAVAAMRDAENELSASKPDAALPHEHKALQALQRAEEEYELQVSASRQGGGGGGGGGGAMQRDLADIFEQELDQIATRYETANRASEQQANQEVDELLEKLRELARRQEQEAERQRRRALEGMTGGGGGSAQQRALAEQLEEAARRLERLAREEQRPELAEAAQQAQQAANAMRRAAASGDANAAAEAQAALERIRETQRQLERTQTARAQRDIEDARQQAAEIQRRQREAAEDMRDLPPPGTAARSQAARPITDQLRDLYQRISELETSLDRAARDASREEREASRRLTDAANAIRDGYLLDRLELWNTAMNRGVQATMDAAERDIAQGIENVLRSLDEARQALGQQDPIERADDAANRARQLARAAESLAERTRERAQQGGQQGQGREGQQGQGQQGQGQQGQGQQGQEGQGQQGQGQQGQQGQGQEGQRGQGQEGQGQGQQAQGQGRGQGQGQGQGRDGQPGQDGQLGGGRLGDGRLGDAGGLAVGGLNRGGDATWGGWWNGARLSPEDIRQLRGEARQFLNDARELRGMLSDLEIDPRDLDEIIAALRRFEDDRIYQDVSELVRLQTLVAERTKRFEFELSRQLDPGANELVLSGTGEVPEEFRAAVEQYYRSLGRSTR